MKEYNNLKFGCEFEFYPNAMIEDEIIEELRSVLKEGAELKINLKNNDDSNMNYKDEPSLNTNVGKEITTPICSYEDLKYYIESIAKIIDANGITNENTGFHIHISTIDENKEVDFYKFMLLCDNASLLSNWGDRNSYCLNVMDILTILDMNEAKKLKNKKGRVWNLEKRIENNKLNHIEIRTIGGTNYQKQVKKILNEFDRLITIFNRSIKTKDNDKEYKYILEKHIEILKSVSEDRKERFLKLIK